MNICDKIIVFACLIFVIECSLPMLNVPEVWVLDLSNKTNPNISLIISCTGDEKLKWNVKVPREYYTVNETITTSGKHMSTIVVDDPVVEDTGYFTCTDSTGKSASTYIYVYDGQSGFVEPKTHSTVSVVVGDPIYLDCRTTHPKIKVSVFKNNVENITNLFEVDQFYRFRKVAESLQETGIYYCRDDLFLNESSWFYNVEPKSRLPIPTIEMYRNSYYIIGENFSVNCTIPVFDLVLPELTWEYPNPNANANQYQWNYNVSPEKIEVVNTLSIKNSAHKDTGIYKCVASQRTTTMTDKSVYIEFKGNVSQFVKIDKNDSWNHIFTVHEGETVNWITYFAAYPNDLTYEILDPYMRKINEDETKVHIGYDYRDGILEVQLLNLSVNDFGKYTAVLTTSNGQLDQNYANIMVLSPPKVQLLAPRKNFSSSENVSVSAFILSSSRDQPWPKVSWWWSEDCPNGVGSCNSANRSLLSHTLNRAGGPKNRFNSSVNFKANVSGLIECHVENEYGSNTTETYLTVTDKNSSFVVIFNSENEVKRWEPKNGMMESVSVIQDDQVTIECFCLDFFYENMFFEGKGSIHNSSTSLSTGRYFYYDSVKLDHQGIFKCAATKRDTNEESVIRFQMDVQEKMAPILLPGSVVSEIDEVKSVESGKNFSMSCYVEGTPAPKITWLKDNVNIKEIEDFLVNEERVSLIENDQVLYFKFAHKDYEGQYECNAENRVGSLSAFATLRVAGGGLNAGHWVVVAVGIALMLLLLGMVVGLMAKVKKESKLRNQLRQNQLYLFEKGNIGDLNTECTIDEQADLLPYDKDFEVEKERIKLGKQLGSGAFGRVMLAEVDGLEAEGRRGRVAVKMCKDGADMAHLRALTLELKIMVHLGKHLNIVNLIGAYTANMRKGDLWILVEYCKYGNILKFMQRHKSRFVNQIDPLTGSIDFHKLTPIPSDPISPVSKSSRGFGRFQHFDADGYLEGRPHGGSERRSKPLERKFSSLSSQSSSQSSRPGLYIGNPNYITPSFALHVAQDPDPGSPREISPPPGGGLDPYVLATQLPAPPSGSRHPSTSSNRSSDGVYHMTHNTEITVLSSPPPFSPSSTVSGEFSFDSQGNMVPSDYGGVPGVSAPFSTMDLICWGWQVANGMEYLSNRKVLHGDLAARNLLLAENNVVKISDFGLSRDMYKQDVYLKKGDEVMPIKWMAPEAIQQKVFSIQSDVWAFGITLWELFTLGNTPYPGVPLDQEFTIALENGMRMDKPKYANEKLYSIMMNCWNADPLDRPNFSILSDQLSEMLSQESRENYVSMNDHYVRRNQEWMEFKEDYLNMVTSPDFRNISSTNDPSSYMEMQTMHSSPDTLENPNIGYLDMRSVRSSPPPTDSIFSPRPPSAEATQSTGETMFSFSGDEVSTTNDQQSPRETSTLLSKENGVLGNSHKEELPPFAIRDNNNVNKINNLNEGSEVLYQNLSKGGIAVSPQDKELSDDVDGNETDLEDKIISYANIPTVNSNYINTASMV